MKKQIILASTSPRRRQAMGMLNLKFKVADPGFEEILSPGMPHGAQVLKLALGKARAAAKKYPKAVIICADTMVSFKGKIIGKPKTAKEAEAMLKAFSGRSHTVLSGVAVLDAASGRVITDLGKCTIYFKKLSPAVIDLYIKSKEPFDKAGGYNLQGAGFNLIAKIEGEFTNILGLPMDKVFNALQALGIKI